MSSGFAAFKDRLNQKNLLPRASPVQSVGLMLPPEEYDRVRQDPSYISPQTMDRPPMNTRNRDLRGYNRRRRRGLQYHYEHDDDWVLQGHDLYPHRSTLQARAKLFFAVAIVTEVLMIAWPSTAISLWGLQQDGLTLAFAIHLFKALLLFIQVFKYTRVYKMYGRRKFSALWGIWTRRSHVRESFMLSTYGLVYGWVHIPLIVMYIIVTLTAKPLIDSDVLYWVQWPMGFVSLVQGYVAWCFIVSEMGIRKPLELYAPSLQRAKRSFG